MDTASKSNSEHGSTDTSNSNENQVLQIFQTIIKHLDSIDGKTISNEIDNILDEDASISRGNGEQMRAQVAFAVKINIDNLLDISRSTYTDHIKRIHDEYDRIVKELDSTDINLDFHYAKQI
jgi:hypothetical protein